MRNIIKYILMVVALIVLSESTFYAFWHKRYQWPVVENYKARLESTKNYTFMKRLKLVMPVPGTTIVHAVPEFVDSFKINSINGFGIFDDGVDEDMDIYALVLGDSFTRGTGSKDNLKYGWVEVVEEKLRKVDLLNLGKFGAGQVTQVRNYDKYKKFLDHQLVIMNFFTGGDFSDNIKKYFDISDYIADLPKEINKDKVLHNILYANNYRISFHYMAYSPFKSYSIWAVLKMYEKFISRFPLLNSFENDYYEYRESMYKFNEKNIPVYVKDLIPIQYSKEISPDNRFLFYYDARLYMKPSQDIADRMAKHSATIINEFFKKINTNKKDFILIIHPSREEIYLSGYKRSDDLYDFDYIRNKFKDYLADAIRVYDITEALRGRAKTSKDPLYYRIDAHYTQAGHREVAELIYKALVNDESIMNVVNNK